jgi:hypothetical protein
MYGSKKPDETDPWQVTKIQKVDMTNSRTESIPIPSLRSLVKTLAIRNIPSDESRYTVAGNKLIEESTPPSKLRNHEIAQIESTDHQQVIDLVDILKYDRANDYNSWIRVGFCLHNISDTLLPTWIEFSERSSKFTEGECETRWQSMRDRGLTIYSLHAWAREDSPAEYQNIIEKYKDPIPKTFKHLISGQYQYNYHEAKEIFESRCFKVYNPICYVEETPTDIIIRDGRKLGCTYQNVYIPGPDGKLSFIKEWIGDPAIRTYDKIAFLPPPEVCSQDIYNQWKGFDIDAINSPSSENVEPFLRHIRILAGHHQESINYMIQYLAQLVQYPGKMPGVAIVLVSEEGAGKNIFLQCLFDILGPQYYYETANPQKDLFDRFCNGRKHKLMINIDEAKAKDTFTNSDLLKNMITSDKFNYEQKGMDPIQLQNFARIIFTTNNDMCVKVTEQDRRYAILQASSEVKGNKDYFDKFVKYMHDITNQKAIMSYLRSQDISSFNFQTSRPKTQLYKTLQSMCSNPLLRFFEYIWMQNHTKTEYIITANMLLDIFYKFLQDELKLSGDTIRVWNRTMFGSKISEYAKKPETGITKKTNYGRDKLNAYSFEMYKLHEYLKTVGVIIETSYMFIDEPILD